MKTTMTMTKAWEMMGIYCNHHLKLNQLHNACFECRQSKQPLPLFMTSAYHKIPQVLWLESILPCLDLCDYFQASLVCTMYNSVIRDMTPTLPSKKKAILDHSVRKTRWFQSHLNRIPHTILSSLASHQVFMVLLDLYENKYDTLKLGVRVPHVDRLCCILNTSSSSSVDDELNDYDIHPKHYMKHIREEISLQANHALIKLQKNKNILLQKNNNTTKALATTVIKKLSS